MKKLLANWPLLMGASILAVLLIILYCVLLYTSGVVPLGGKKAPSFVIVLMLEYFLVRRVSKSSSAHFLKLFVFQYLFIVLVGLFCAILFYTFYETTLGLRVLNEYIQISISELQVFKGTIIEQEGIPYYTNLLNGINGIDAMSIAKDDFTQKITLAFLPNLLMSLYFKQN